MAIDVIDAAGNRFKIAGRGAVGPRGKPGPAGPKGDTGDDGNPIGTIISFLGLAAPEGYLVCDGSTHSISDYPYLSAFIAAQFGSASHFGGDGETTFAVPDMRNLFLRGYHGDAEEQLSGNIGVRQEGTEVPKTLVNTDGTTTRIWSNAPTVAQDIQTLTYDRGTMSSSKMMGTDLTIPYAATAPSISIGSIRPVNMAVLYCIKAAKTVPSAPVIQVVGSNPNLLRNWYFPNPVNQRGQNVYTGIGYTIDQWRVEGNLKVTLESGWLKLENETDDAHWFIQKAEQSLLKELSGHTVTHSVLCKGVGTNLAIYFGYDEGGEWKVPNGALIPTDGNVSVAQCTTVIPDTTDATNFQVFYFGIYPHSTLYIKAVKLELGPTQTLAHQDEYGAWKLNGPPPDYGAELAKCQRYFERSVWNVSVATALSTSEIEFCGSYYFKVQKRGDVNITVGTGAQELLVYDTVTKQNITGARALKPTALNLGMFSPRVQDPQNRFVVGRLYQVIIPDWQYDISSEL